MTPDATDRPALPLVGSLAIAVVALVVAGCSLGSSGGDAEKLEALRNDPMARYEPPGGRLVDSEQVEEHTAFGKDVEAKLTRVFSLPAGNLGDHLDHALEAAGAAGWAVSKGPVIRMDNAFGQAATKRLRTGSAQMSLTVYPSGTPGGSVHGPALVITLRHS
jgi:hypothetical protein